MMAALQAAKKHEVILLDGNERIGKKLFITGKGRCNVTNSKDISEFFEYIPGNPHFLYSSLYSFTNDDTMNFFESEGIKLKVERGDRVFPESDKSSDIIRGLSNALSKWHNLLSLFKELNYIETKSGADLFYVQLDQAFISVTLTNYTLSMRDLIKGSLSSNT